MKRGFWQWLQEDHPVIHEVVWWSIDIMAITALIASCVRQ